VLVIQARCLERLKRYDEAADSYQRILDLDPDSTEALYGRARCLIRQGKTAEAVPLLRRSLELDPEQSRVKRLLEWIEKREKGTGGA
jgi:tetratricopeptide (TPR) repeat protein